MNDKYITRSRRCGQALAVMEVSDAILVFPVHRLKPLPTATLAPWPREVQAQTNVGFSSDSGWRRGCDAICLATLDFSYIPYSSPCFRQCTCRMDSLPQRPEYEHSRLLVYLNHIKLYDHRLPLVEAHVRHRNGLPPSVKDIFHDENVESTLLALRALHQHQLARVPFENLSLHYSLHKTIDLNPDALYEKIVTNGRGGYCMENNCFFGTVLRSLGYKVYDAGARVHEGDGKYTAWSHMVNIVTLANGRRYVVDVGFGNNGPTKPLLLENGHKENSFPPASMRLVQETIPQTTIPDDRLWIYQHRSSPTSEWESMYSFTETEFLPRDYEVMNFWTSQNRKSWFTYRIMCVKQLMDRNSHELMGTLILTGGQVKMRVGETTEHLRVCKTEHHRVDALETIFGIRLTEEEKEGIRGMVTELCGTSPG